MVAELSIGTSATRVNLLDQHGYMLDKWTPGDTLTEGIWQESRLADYRQLAAYRDTTTIERFDLKLVGDDADAAARQLQGLRTVLRTCLNFWTTTWETSVVYVKAKAECETNERYAVVHDARLLGEGNPFSQPFMQAGGAAVMDELVLMVEIGPWLENAPGTGTCVEISSQGPDNTPFILNFDGAGDNINCGSGASLDNLPSAGDFTVEAWIKAEDWGGPTDQQSSIMNKGAWYLNLNIFRGIEATAPHAVTTAATSTGLDDFSIDYEWHHVAAVWTLASLRWDIALDGEWVSTTVTPGVGAYTGDATNDLYIGDNFAAAFAFDGLIGWSRITSSARYTVGRPFTPPDRCTCPTVDGDTEGLWCLAEGTGATAYDETANNNDGTITGAAWEWSGCEKEYMAATCDAQSVFVANKHNVAPITHCYYWDDSAGQWTDGGAPPNNLIGDATPYAFLPAVPGADDFVIFGINTALADSGPFSSLVFDIGTALDAGTGVTIEWRYKATGDADDPGDAVNPWTAITVQDNTDTAGAMTGDAFDTTGIGSVHWEQPSDWETSNPDPGVALGVTAYWICAYVTASNDDGTPPQQQNRDIYTVTWPYIELAATQIDGDMPALLRLSVDSRSAQNAVPDTTNLWCQRVIAGLRSMDRGADFTSYINVSDEQNGPSITISITGSMAAFGAVTTAPTGRASLYTPGGAVAMATQVRIRLGPDWYGRFHAFVRGQQASGAAGTIGVRLGYLPGGSAWPATQYTATRQFVNTADDQLLDFGEILLGTAADVYPLEVSHTYIEIEAGTSAAATAYFYELILIPIDEWAIDAEEMAKNTGALGYTNDYWSHWEGDGIRNQRKLLSYLVGTASGRIARYWRPITNGIPILQTGKQQRLWFLHARCDDYADTDDVRADSEICSTIQIWKNQRYSTLRGDQ